MNIGTNVTGITIPEGTAKNIKRGTELLWQDGGLPTAFQRCEYIESHGTEYINTGFIPGTSFDFSVEMTCKVNYMEGWRSLFGAYNWQLFTFSASSFAYICEYGPGAFSTINSLYQDFQKVRAEKNSIYLNDEVAYSYDWKVGSTQSRAIYLLHSNAGRFNNGPIAAKLKETVIKNILSGEKSREYIPCYLKTDWNGIPAGTIGLYDICGSLSANGTPFYTNEGTGAFTKGPDVT